MTLSGRRCFFILSCYLICCSHLMYNTKISQKVRFHSLSLFIGILLGNIVPLYAQAPSQVIRGLVIDQSSEAPLPGATLLLRSDSLIQGVISDQEGVFRFEGVSVGRYQIEVRYIGYESQIVPEILVSSARSVILEIRMQESASEIEGIVVKAQVRKDIPINRMAVVSARTFTVEETRRYAGGFDDPGRMAASFAGVAGGSPNDNALSIRGNSPKGLLWRLEGVTVPNPNHFAGMLVEGGGILSLVSGQLLNNSDFFLGAFPAEYGNALSGVFDMNLRTGDSEKQGWGLQVGTLGIDGFGEGPLIKGKGASYIFNYRYSTTALLKGIIPEGQMPVFQDLSFKLNFPTGKTGTFSVWGVGGLDQNGSEPSENIADWSNMEDRIRFTWNGKIGMLGLKHRLTFGGSSALNTSLTVSTSQFSDSNDFLMEDGRYMDYKHVNNLSSMVSFRTVLTHKFSSRLSNRSGLVASRIAYDIGIHAADEPGGPAISYAAEQGATSYLQGFSQFKWTLNPSLSLTGGFHSVLFLLNQSATIEPRLGASYKFLEENSLSIAYGNHSQIEPLPAYFYQYENGIGHTVLPNRNLSPSRSHHFVTSYSRLLAKNLRFSAEVYYQQLYNIPVKPEDPYSMINFKKEYLVKDSLTNEGTGVNQGLDLTIEKFLSKNYYFLITGSLIDSKYKGGDNLIYNSRWDYGFVFNTLAGREFYLGENRERILGINARFVIQGGERVHPIDQASSLEEQRVVYDYSRAWEDRLPNSLFIDFTTTLRINHKRYSSVWGVQIKNMLLENSVYNHVFNPDTQEVQLKGQGFFFPNISYKIEF